MADQLVTPLYPNYTQLIKMVLVKYPSVNKLLLENESLNYCAWLLGKSFLINIGNNCSVNTYDRFRCEIERYILWLIYIKKKTLDKIEYIDVIEYIQFCMEPPRDWFESSNYHRFKRTPGIFIPHPKWRPFKRLSNDQTSNSFYPSEETQKCIFTALKSFYYFLIEKEVCIYNPVDVARKKWKFVNKKVTNPKAINFSSKQWDFILSSVMEMANKNEIYERNLFLIYTLKTFNLNISDLSNRSYWKPQMNHFSEDKKGNWWFKVCSMHRKIKTLPVPKEFLIFFERYRIYRNLPGLPTKNESYALIEKIRGNGGMTVRHLRRLVREVFDTVFLNIKNLQGNDEAQWFKKASCRWLKEPT